MTRDPITHPAIPLTATNLVFLAKVGRLVFHWNQLESAMVELAATITSPKDHHSRSSAKKWAIEAGMVSLCNAIRAISEDRATATSAPLIEKAATAFDRLREHRNYIVHGVYGLSHARMDPLTEQNKDLPMSEAFTITDKPNAHVIGHSAKGKNLFILDFIAESTIDEVDKSVREWRSFTSELETWIRWEARRWEREDDPKPPPPPSLPNKLKKQAYSNQALRPQRG